MSLRVALLHDPAAERPGAPPDACGVAEALAAVAKALQEAGHTPCLVPACGTLDHWLAALGALAPDVVFNLCEGTGADELDEVRVAAAVADLGLPHTGSPAATLARARHKGSTNALLAAAGVPVADWTLVEDAALPAWDVWPAIVKPAAEDASVGIGAGSVVEDRAGLQRALAAAPRPALVQRYLPGREFNVAFVGTTVLPVAEICFDAWRTDAFPRVTYAAKWAAGSADDLGTRPVCPAPLDATATACLQALAREAWAVVGGTGYGRVDLRMDAAGTPHVLEVNPNADLAPDAGLARMAAAAGWSYTELVERILAAALAPDPGRGAAHSTMGAPAGLAMVAS
ncbi:MAG: D-alanine--D-alanine ligase [Gemmatimonadota bacterium]